MLIPEAIATEKDSKQLENKSKEFYYDQFQQIFDMVNKHYVDTPDNQKMTDAAIDGMLRELDPHSSYLTGTDLEDLITHTKGEFGGIGIEIIYDNGAVKVVSPIDDLPAYKAGIKAGDYIVGVNNQLVHSLGFNKSVREMRGTPGTKVELLVVNPEETKPKEITLTREIVKIKPVKFRLEGDDIAYIRIVTFNEQTELELQKAIKSLMAKNKIKGIILDLRNNPGGLLNEAVAVSSYFLQPEKDIVLIKDKNHKDTILQSNFNKQKITDIPMVILVNSGSASASEIVAGALQDNHRAILIGTQTFGKASVQTLIPVNKDAAMKLTTSKYYTPKGKAIQAKGIEPDIVIEQLKVEYPKEQDGSWYLKRFSEASLKNYLKNDNDKKNASTKKPTEKPKVKEDKYKSSAEYKDDYQYARACDVIRGLIVTSDY